MRDSHFARRDAPKSTAGIFAFEVTLSVLDGELADLLTDALLTADVPAACTLVRAGITGGTAFDPVLTDVSYPCKGWRDTYSAQERVNSSVQENDAKVYVLCSTLLGVVPLPADRIVVSGSTFTVINVQRDPAGAAWVLQCRV